MRRILPYFVVSIISFIFLYSPSQNDKRALGKYINSHPFAQRPRMNSAELKRIPKKDRPDLAWEQDYLSTLDPSLGRPVPERLESVHNQVDQLSQTLSSAPGSPVSPWVERGPTNVGGRTRALLWDPNDVTGKKVWAGGVTGGLWYNTDITSTSSSWVSVGNFWDNIAITCIAYDPNNTNVFYVGTGEGWGTASSRGGGIWKSTNGGTTWTRLSSTTAFYYVNDIVVRNENGSSVVYAAIDGNFYNGAWHGATTAGLQRSTNGGSSWSQVLPNIPGASVNYVPSDLEISPNNRLWVGTRRTPYAATDRGGGRILYSTNGTTWTTAYSASGIISGYGRVEVAVAPSNSNYVYGMIENGNEVYQIVRTTNGGSSWSLLSEPNDDDLGIPSSDFSRGQAWYDLILAVDPNNVNKVIAGAINAHMTLNGGSSWSQISKWSNNPNMGFQNYSYVHADHHNILFKPGSSTEVIFGTDGGVFWTNNLTNAATSAVIQPRNNGYNVTQFYAGAMHPNSGSNFMLAGSQDNGTQRFTLSGLASTTEATGGDGGYCFIDQTNPNYQITSYVYNSYWRSVNGGVSFQNPRIQTDFSTGRFINPTDYDDNTNVLYSAHTTSTINRIKNMESTPAIDFFTVSGMSSMASHLRVSPYTTNSTTLFVGTEAGDLYKITNANGNSPIATSIGSALPAGHVSCVEIGANENELLVTLKNYGVTSVWYTSNGGTTWVNKEGNLPDMPVRWALFNPNNYAEVLLATEVGIWATQNFTSSSPTWAPSNSGLAHVRVDMLQLRDSDLRVMAITHGRGVFTSDGFNVPVLPVADFGADKVAPCLNETVSFTDSSSGTPTSFSWSISPATHSFVNGTNAQSQNPQVQFSAQGSYTVSLIVTNSQGSDTLTRTQYIQAGGATLPFLEDFESGANGWTVSNPDNSTTWALYTVSGTSPGNTAAGIDNYNYSSAGQRDGLISPALNLSGYNIVNLSFSYAYRRYSSSYQDSLAVFVSTNCGSSWTRVASFKEDGTGNFVTGSDLSTAFYPSSSADWCGSSPQCPTISLNNFAGNANVKIKIENITGWGNNLYVDNINITGVNAAAPVANFSASKTNPCVNEIVNFNDLSVNNPNGWVWSFSPSTVSFAGGTQSTSQNPQVIFQQAGNYQVTLTATNSIGSDTEVKTGFINVQNSLTPSVSISASATTVCSGTTVNFTATPTNGGSTPIYQWKVNGNNVGSNSGTYSTSTLNNNDVVTVELTSNATCVTAASTTSNAIPVTVNPTVTPSVSISASATTVCSGTTVNFTATPTNGGSTPSYQWKVNGNNAGGNSATFSTSTLNNNDIVTVELTSNATCVTTASTTSNAIAVTVNPTVTPSVSISASATTVCSGTTVNFTATPTNGGSTPSYQWKVNGNNAGGNSATFSTSTLNNNDIVTVELTSNATCVTTTSANSNSITISVNPPVTASVSISASATTVCSGAIVNFTATPTNGGSTPSYQWKVNGNNVGSNSATYSTSTLNNNDIVTVELTSNATCVTSTSATSNAIAVTVNPPVTASVSISASATTVCSGTTVNFTATPTNGGSTPIYQWKVNGNNVGSNSATYSTSTLNNNDIVTVELTSNATCVTAASATSNAIPVTVNLTVTPSVSISASATTVCSGTTVNFTATPTNGGSTPIYQWKVNGTNVGSNSATYSTSTLNSNDVVTVELTSNATCVTTASATSNAIAVTVNLTPTVGINTTVSGILCNQDTLQLSGSPSGGTFSGGSGVVGNSFIPSLAGSGLHWIYYTVTGTSGCIGKDSIQVQVESLPVPTISASGTLLTCNQGGYAYQWYDQNGVIPGANAITYTVTANGSYRVEITTSNCSMFSDIIQINNIHLEEWKSISDINVYPNPARAATSIYLNALYPDVVEIELYNAIGQLLFRDSWRISQGQNFYEIDCSNLKSGVYQIRMKSKNGSNVQRFEVR